jgi:hypothetical protein
MTMQVSKLLTASGFALIGALISISFGAHADPVEIPGKDGATYDLGTFKSVGLETFDICSKPYTPDRTLPSGATIKMLGAALVYMGPSNGQSMFGHVAERFVYCRNEQLFDAVYEYSQPDPLMMSTDKSTFEKEYGVTLTDAEGQNIKKSLYVTITYAPANYYLMEQLKVSRTIYEAWLNLDPDAMFKMLSANSDRYQEQVRKIRAHEPLPDYKFFSANCATDVKNDMAIINPAFLTRTNPLRLGPGSVYNGTVRRGVKKIMIYPSQHVLRLLRDKQAGKNTLFEGFVPLSKSLRHAFPGAWVVLYDDGTSPWRRFVLTPVYGSVNFVAGVFETAYGVATIPLDLFKRITGIRKAQREKIIQQRMKDRDITEEEAWKLGFTDKVGLGRIKLGINAIFSSLSEVMTLRLRYPIRTDWTDEEIEFLHGIAQNSALLDYMKTEWESAPLVVQGDASDEIRDPAPEAPKVEAPEKFIAPRISVTE